MSIGWITGSMFLSMLILLATGFPIAFSLFSVAALFALFLWGPSSLSVIGCSLLSQSSTIIMIAVPAFLFMGLMLQRSGIAEDLYYTMHCWLGSLPGGLAIGTVIICAVFAAMSGISGTACVTMGIVAVPSMIKRGYHKGFSLGVVGGGSGLGVLIPPSVIMIVYAQLAMESVGQLFLSGVIPGLMFCSLFITYVAIRAIINPELAPALPKEERVGWKEKLFSLKNVILPIVLVGGVLGSIFTGAATPTEAAAFGALGSIGCAMIYRRLSWEVLKDSCIETMRVSVMILWIMIAANAFAAIYQALGAVRLITDAITSLPVSPISIVIGMMVILALLGCLMDSLGLLMITGPIFIPMIKELGFSPIWFGILYTISLEIGFLTPPFGINLFYLKGVTSDKDISMGDIYQSMTPYTILYVVGLILVLFFPNIALWLPSKYF